MFGVLESIKQWRRVRVIIEHHAIYIRKKHDSVSTRGNAFPSIRQNFSSDSKEIDASELQLDSQITSTEAEG
jgi:hypothetical protein